MKQDFFNLKTIGNARESCGAGSSPGGFFIRGPKMKYLNKDQEYAIKRLLNNYEVKEAKPTTYAPNRIAVILDKKVKLVIDDKGEVIFAVCKKSL